jgi:mono/diheme cytochrome c family protein
VGDDVADPMSIDSSQLNVQKREAEGREIFIVTFPPPQAMPEAYFAAMVYAEGTPSRYLTLERSFDLLTNQVITMLGEWHKDGDHGNLGFGPNPTVDGFLEAVVALITNGTRVPDRPQNTDVEAGGAIYHGKGVCFVCHGPNGKGDGEAGARLKPPPTDFTDPRFQESRTDSDLFRAIRDGIPRTGMISMNPAMINDTETWDVIAYIRSLKGM